jgi:hypothetical protein
MLPAIPTPDRPERGTESLLVISTSIAQGTAETLCAAILTARFQIFERRENPMTCLTPANQEQVRRSPVERFESLDTLAAECGLRQDESLNA